MLYTCMYLFIWGINVLAHAWRAWNTCMQAWRGHKWRTLVGCTCDLGKNMNMSPLHHGNHGFACLQVQNMMSIYLLNFRIDVLACARRTWDICIQDVCQARCGHTGRWALASCTSALGKKNTHTPMYCLYCHGVHGFACLHVQTEYHVKNMCNI